MRRGGGTSAALDHAREIDIGLRYTVRMPDHAALGALTRATSPGTHGVRMYRLFTPGVGVFTRVMPGRD